MFATDWTMRRCVWIPVVLAVAVTPALVTLWHLKATKAEPTVVASVLDYEQIKTGMTREQVQAILGGMPGDYTTGPSVFIFDGLMMYEEQPDEWKGDAGWIWVKFDNCGIVAWTRYQPVIRLAEPSSLLRFMDKLTRFFAGDP